MTNRIARIAGAIGAATAALLTMSGCGLIPGMGETGTKAINPEYVELQQEWIAAFGEDREVANPAAKAGLEYLHVMVDQFPQFTVHGFVPTDENMAEAVAAYRPLVTENVIKDMEADFADDKGLPVVMSYRTDLNSEGVHGYTFTAPSGEKCTDSATPWDVEARQTYLTANAEKTPGVISNIGIVIPCQEGYRLAMTMKSTFDLGQQDGKWLVTKTYDWELNKEYPVQIIK